MKLKRIKEDYYQKIIGVDSEVLHNKGRRPYVIIMKLNYKGTLQNFAIPLRSNISVSAPRYTFFSLPKRSTTKDYHVHGLHYIKLVPICNRFLENIEMSDTYKFYLEIIRKNKEQIRNEVQAILDQYGKGIIAKYSTNLDGLIEVCRSEKEISKKVRKTKK